LNERFGKTVNFKLKIFRYLFRSFWQFTMLEQITNLSFVLSIILQWKV